MLQTLCASFIARFLFGPHSGLKTLIESNQNSVRLLFVHVTADMRNKRYQYIQSMTTVPVVAGPGGFLNPESVSAKCTTIFFKTRNI